MGQPDHSVWRVLESEPGLPLSRYPKTCARPHMGFRRGRGPRGAPVLPLLALLLTSRPPCRLHHHMTTVAPVDLLPRPRFLLHAESSPGPGPSRAPCRAPGSCHPGRVSQAGDANDPFFPRHLRVPGPKFGSKTRIPVLRSVGPVGRPVFKYLVRASSSNPVLILRPFLPSLFSKIPGVLLLYS